MNQDTSALKAKGWEIKTLGEVCEIQLGKTPSRSNSRFWDKKQEANNIWLSIADLSSKSEKKISDSKEYISDKGAALCKIVPKGTLMVSFKLTLGRLAYAGRDLFTNEAIASLFTKNDKLFAKDYLYYYLSFFDWQKAAKGEEKVKGKTLNKAKLEKIEVIIPPLAEQKTIVKKLDALSAETRQLESIYQRKLKALGELKQSLLQQAFNGELTS